MPVRAGGVSAVDFSAFAYPQAFGFLMLDEERTSQAMDDAAGVSQPLGYKASQLPSSRFHCTRSIFGESCKFHCNREILVTMSRNLLVKSRVHC